jgi:hypothetical protein
MALLDNLIASYRDRLPEMGQHDKAIAERDIWALVKRQGNAGGTRMREWFRDNVSKKDVGGYETRQQLLKHGAALDEFWAYVDSKHLTTSAMVDLLEAARKLLNHQSKEVRVQQRVGTLVAALERVIFDREFPGEEFSDTTKPVVKPVPEPAVVVEGATDNSKEFWRGIREYANHYVGQRLADFNEDDQREVMNTFETNLKVAVDALFSRINWMKQQARQQTVTAINTKFRMACDRLDVPPARDGKFDYERAKKQYKALAFALHPDRNTNPGVVQQYNDVQQAWQIITQWWELNKGSAI